VVAALTDRETLDALIAAHQTLAIGFDDEATEASRVFRQALEDVAPRLPEIAFRRVAWTSSNPLAAMFGFESAPALVLFREGLGLFAGPAAFSATQLEALLRRALALDITKAREELRRDREAESMIAMRRACPAGRRGNLA
jgi:thioredoxin 1